MDLEQRIDRMENTLTRVMFKLDMFEIIDDCQGKIVLLNLINSLNIPYSNDLVIRTAEMRLKAGRYLTKSFTTNNEEFMSMLRDIYTFRDNLNQMYDTELDKIIMYMQRQVLKNEILTELRKQIDDEKQKNIDLKKKEDYKINKYIR